jgi:hypothetical protein
LLGLKISGWKYCWLIYCERKTLLAGWKLKRTGWMHALIWCSPCVPYVCVMIAIQPPPNQSASLAVQDKA